jgi:hypothetical protein
MTGEAFHASHLASPRPFFVVRQATTRHPCVYMMPWPIFQPMILAYVVTGGNI